MQMMERERLRLEWVRDVKISALEKDAGGKMKQGDRVKKSTRGSKYGRIDARISPYIGSAYLPHCSGFIGDP